MTQPRSIVACLTLLLMTSFATSDERLKGIACRSVHLHYPAERGTLFHNEITIQSSAPGTYFAVCGWDKGYFGLQELGNGKKLLIFSVWDSGQNNPNAVEKDRRVKLLHKDEKVRTGRFGGEGTGGQSFFDYDWKVGQTYRLMVTAKPNGMRTEYAGYFFVPEDKAWKHLVTFSTLTGGRLLGGYYSFVEDFKRDRKSPLITRAALFGNGWIHDAKENPVPLTTAQFTADRNPVLNIRAELKENRFYLATGGAIELGEIKLRERIKLPKLDSRKPPQDLPRK